MPNKSIKKEDEEEYVDFSKINTEELAERSSFWAFTGKWAVIGILVGAYLLWTKEFLSGILVLAASIGYIAFRLNSIKTKYK